MVVVIASRADPTGRSIAADLGPNGRLLVPADLSGGGWAIESAAPGRARLTIGGEPVGAHEIDGVVCRLPRVIPAELDHIAAQDRDYVAAECTAMLTWWLSALRCRRVNPPSAACLSGPDWRPEQWVQAAAAAGLPVVPLRRRTAPDPGAAKPETQRVDLLDGRPIGDVPRSLVRPLAELARRAGCTLLHAEVTSADGRFVGASGFPGLEHDEVRAAVVEYLGATQEVVA